MRRPAAACHGGQHRGSCTPGGGWRKRGTQKQAIGRSRGGPTTKIHALCDQLGRLYALMLTGGQVHDIWGARGLLACVATPARFLGDKAYDADDIRDYLAADGSEAVIPSKANRKEPIPHDPIAYKMRNIIERSFNRLKDWRGIATRYDKKAANFLAGVCLASAITYWLQ
jgi:transposase